MNYPPIDVHLDPQADLTKALTDAGHPNPAFWEETLTLLAPGALNKESSSHWRRLMINRAMHVVIDSFEHPSGDHLRSMLVDYGSYDTWLELIQHGIAPALAKIAKGV